MMYIMSDNLEEDYLTMYNEICLQYRKQLHKEILQYIKLRLNSNTKSLYSIDRMYPYQLHTPKYKTWFFVCNTCGNYVRSKTAPYNIMCKNNHM